MTGPLGCTKDRSRPVLTSPFKPPLGQGPGPGPGTGPIILQSRSGPTDLGPGLFTGPGPVQGPDPATLPAPARPESKYGHDPPPQTRA